MPGIDPALAIVGETASRNEEVHARMKRQRASPGMQHAAQAELRAEILRIGRQPL